MLLRLRRPVVIGTAMTTETVERPEAAQRLAITTRTSPRASEQCCASCREPIICDSGFGLHCEHCARDQGWPQAKWSPKDPHGVGQTVKRSSALSSATSWTSPRGAIGRLFFTSDRQRLFWAWILIYLALSPVCCTHLYFSHRKRKSAKPKWINPCGINLSARKRLASHFSQTHSFEVTPLSHGQLLENVLLAARNALKHSSVFKEDYVKKTFRVDSWWEHHETWRDMRYQWLSTWDEIPKHLHQRTDRSHLEALQIEKAIKDIYRYLQKMAVGLEQVVLDQTLYDGHFMEEFNEAEFKLKAVLCELQITMMEMGLAEDPVPTTRDIMRHEIRDVENKSYRDLRDWYIYRDYMNGLEYAVHSFLHLKRSHETQSHQT